MFPANASPRQLAVKETKNMVENNNKKVFSPPLLKHYKSSIIKTNYNRQTKTPT